MKISRVFRRRLTVARKLREEGFKPLRWSNRYWDRLAHIYINQANNPKFIKYRSTYSTREVASRLKFHSKKALTALYDPDNLNIYRNARRWCVVPINIHERARRKGFTFLDMNEDSDKDMDIWELRIVHYRMEEGEIDLHDIIGRPLSMDPKSLSKKVKMLKNSASSITSKWNYDEDGEEAWNTSIRWFTKERP